MVDMEGKGEITACGPLEGLYREHSAGVYTYALRSLGDASAAEDVTQDVFLRALKAIERGRYEARGKERGWLLTIAHNVVADKIARLKRQPILLDNVSMLESPRDDKREMRDLLQSGLCKLRDIERDIVVMRHYLGMSFEEISDTLGVPGGTTRSYMCRALDKLAELLKKEVST